MVVGVLAALAAMTKVRYSYTAVDSQVFRLHYRWTTTFLFACCALVVAKEYVGKAIECVVDNKKEVKVINTYCWITSTFTINSTGPFLKGLSTYFPDLHEQRYHSYYQWVPCVLFLQGCLFYAPHLIWKCYEGKQVDRLLQDLNKGLFDPDAGKKKKNLVSYLRESWGLNIHYASIYHLCEVVNLANVFFQMYAIDKFLGGIFWNYGPKVLSLISADDSERDDTLLTTFPRRTKCTYRKIGSGGGVKTDDVLCVLPQNIINDKIYIVMWFWFVILAVITSGWLIWRLVVLLSPSLRRRILERLMKRRVTEKMEQTIRCLHLGDFCLLENIGHNLDILSFRDVMKGVTDAMEEFSPTAPVDEGTYTPFFKPDDVDLMPRRRSGFADTGF